MPAPSMTKILVDCDPGHDDAVAILFAGRRLDLVGVTTQHGNNTVENTTRNALAVMELAGIDAPVFAGCGDPLVQARVHAGDIHGKTGLDGADVPAPTRTAEGTHAVDAIIALASRHREELVVALIGPQTNFAVALAREPRLRTWVRELTVMGGSTTLGNITPAAEFNVYADPEAAAAVFGSGIPIRMVGYNVTRQTGFDQGDIDRLQASGRTVAGLVSQLMAFYLGRQQRAFGLTVAPMHDVCALVPYVDATLIDYLATSVKIELAGMHTRGMTVCDMRNVRADAVTDIATGHGRNAQVATAAKSRALIDLVVGVLLEYA